MSNPDDLRNSLLAVQRSHNEMINLLRSMPGVDHTHLDTAEDAEGIMLRSLRAALPDEQAI